MKSTEMIAAHAFEERAAAQHRQSIFLKSGLGLLTLCLAAGLIISVSQIGRERDHQGSAAESGRSGDGGIGTATAAALLSRYGISISGEALTDEEAAEYFAENAAWIKSSLANSGVALHGAVTFSQKGYSYLSIQEEGVTLAQNFRDYLVTDEEGLVSIVTLVKEGGTISAGIAFGGDWYGEYETFLKQHTGEKLIYVLIGHLQAVLTPDGEIYNTLGTDLSSCFPEGAAWYYEKCDCGNNTYIP